MFLNHIALVCSSEQNSDSFYQKLLGLDRMMSKTVPADLSKKIFDTEEEYTIINYGNDNMRFEIFISDRLRKEPVNHVCINVPDMDAFLAKCETMKVTINRIPYGDYDLIFIEDFDGNLFEIKEMS